MNSEKLILIVFILILVNIAPGTATGNISTQDGLKLVLAGSGAPSGIAIDGTYLPMLAAQGGFSFREVLTSGPNLIANPGFERGTGTPLNWSFVAVNGNTPAWDTISHSGTRSIKISIPGTGDAKSGYPKSDPVKADPSQYYTLSAWVKAIGAAGTYNPTIRIVELDAGKGWLGQTNFYLSKGTYDWTWNKISFQTSGRTRWIYVYANIWNGYGTVWLDDMVLTESPNLLALANPSFEIGADKPLNWSLVTVNGNTPAWDTISHSGTRSIKISIPGTGDSTSGYLKSDLVKADPFRYYTLYAWAKSLGVGGANEPAVRVVELDANKQWLRQTNLVLSEGTSDWTVNQRTFQTGMNTSWVYIYANIWNGYGTVWLDDVKLEPSFWPTAYLNNMLVWNLDGTVTQKTRASDIDFTFTYIPRGRYIEVHGEIQDFRGTDRAIQLMYNLPVNANGWRWGDYIRGSRTIEKNTQYENVYLIGDSRAQSVYPFASIDNTARGLSIAVPMDVPRIYRIGYNLGKGYSIQYDFGLSSQTLKIGPGHANFTFAIYKTDEPGWGFRSTVKKYYELYPRFFVKKNGKEGTIMSGWDNDPSSIPNLSDFGFASDVSHGFVSNWGNPRQIYDTNNGIYKLQTSEPWGLWMDFGSNSTKPSYAERMAALNDASVNSGSETWRGIVPLSEAANAIKNSALYDPSGKMYLDTTDYFWSYWGSWMQNYPTNPDPDVPVPNRFGISYKKYQLASNKPGGFIYKWWFEQNASWDSTVYHSSNHSAKIEITGNKSRTSGRWVSNNIPVKPSTTYVFSAWGQTGNAGGDNLPAVRIVEIDTNGMADYSRQRNLVFGTNKWTQENLTFTTSSNTASVFIYASIWNGYGIIWFDDISLHEIGSGVNLIPNSGLEFNNGNSRANSYTVDGINLDVFLTSWVWSPLENYRRDHWKYVNSPLVFSYTNKQPVLLETFSQYEYTDSIRKKLNTKNLIMANIATTAYGLNAHLIDLLGGEIGDLESDSSASLRRTLSYQKTNSNLLQWNWNHANYISYSEMEKYIKLNTFYAMFPSIYYAAGTRTGTNVDLLNNNEDNVYWQNSSLYERDRPLFKKYIPVIRNISSAGWEPITYAVANNHNIKIERYGKANNLYYTVINTEPSTQTGTITVDLARLGIYQSSITAKELLSGKVYYLSANNGKISLSVSLNSYDLYVLRLS